MEEAGQKDKGWPGQKGKAQPARRQSRELTRKGLPKGERGVARAGQGAAREGGMQPMDACAICPGLKKV